MRILQETDIHQQIRAGRWSVLVTERDYLDVQKLGLWLQLYGLAVSSGRCCRLCFYGLLGSTCRLRVGVARNYWFGSPFHDVPLLRKSQPGLLQKRAP